ncbi:MAG: enoyl-CoA hydratase-related protein [Bacteroidetes bacterium]|nr:enoyl-CoA hydratase-related protein [Bacteroidota bacterium]
MTYQFILTEVSEKILTITIDRPDKLNALNRDLLQEIKQAVLNAQTDNAVAGIILTGSGNKAFAAGADIAEFASYTVEEGTALSGAGHLVMNEIENSIKPVIAAVNGFALGGGCELAMACHIRIASTNAKFGQPEVKLGLIPGYGGTQRLTRYIGKAQALEFLLTAENISAEKAYALGLVNNVVPQEDLIAQCRGLLEKVITKSPLTVAQILKLSNDFDHGNGFEQEIKEFGICFGTNDFKEGTDAFLNKRAATFTGS